VVYGIPEGKELSKSPYFSPEECQATWRAETTLRSDNTLSGQLSFEAVGTPEGRLRRTLAGIHPGERMGYFDRTFQRISPNARPVRVTCMDPVDYSGPLEVEAEFKAPHYALGDAHLRMFKLPMLQTVFGDRTLYDILGGADRDEREYGVKLLATRRGLIEETIQLPPGWEPTDLPEPIDIDGPSAALRFEISSEPGQLRYTCDLVVKRWTIPPDEYANFKEVVDKFTALSDRMIRCELEGARAQR
jgi:hypothetical protein